MIYFLAVLSLLSCSEGFSFNSRALSARSVRVVSGERSFTALNALAKVKKNVLSEDAPKAAKKSTKTKERKQEKEEEKEVDLEREELMLDIVTQLMEKLNDMEKGGGKTGYCCCYDIAVIIIIISTVAIILMTTIAAVMIVNC